MPLNLDPACKTRLVELINEWAVDAPVHHGTYLHHSAFASLDAAQAALPRTGSTRARIDALVSDMAIKDFLAGEMAKRLSATEEFTLERAPVALGSIAAYSDTEALSNELVRQFESLPWEYMVSAAMPAGLGDVFTNVARDFELSDAIHVRADHEDITRRFPLPTQTAATLLGDALAGLLEGRTGWSNAAHLQIPVHGYIAKGLSTEPLIEAVGLIKAFYGLGLALRLFRTSYSFEPAPKRERIYVHRLIDGEWIFETTSELELKHSEVIRSIRLDDLGGSLATDADREGWARSILSDMSVVLRAKEQMRHLLLGAQWFLDSHTGEDELLQFVQAAVVVEILLGDKASSDLVGLGELLSNRCAYLISTSHAQRAELLKDFRNIYDVRSKIVHRGKSRLTRDERDLFWKLRWICQRIIQEEVKLMKKGVHSS